MDYFSEWKESMAAKLDWKMDLITCGWDCWNDVEAELSLNLFFFNA